MIIISQSKLNRFTLVVSCLWTPSKNYWVMWWNWCIISINHLLHDSPCIYSNAVHFLLNSKKLNFGEIGKFPSWSDRVMKPLCSYLQISEDPNAIKLPMRLWWWLEHLTIATSATLPHLIGQAHSSFHFMFPRRPSDVMANRKSDFDWIGDTAEDIWSLS